jgi:uncharacterized protein
MKRYDVWIPCGPLMLEGILEIPGDLESRCPAAVICHPHPLYGGNMHNNVVRALRKGLLDQGFACLRFNFRGTEGSWGSHGNGVDEEDDVLAAMDFISARLEVTPGRFLVAGYSFGCWVGLKAAARDIRPTLLVGVSPPLDAYDFSFLRAEKRPKLLVSGDRDFVCPKDRFEELVQMIPQPMRGVLLPGIDHFHVGREDALTRELRTFLEEST